MQPDKGFDGELSRAMVVAMSELQCSERQPVLGEGKVLALPGPLTDEEFSGDLAQRSWHARVGGQVVRALEYPPLRDFESGRLRARHLRLHNQAGSAPQAPGQLLWIDQDVRIFAADAFPGLDDPLPATSFGPAVELLVEELRGTPWTLDVPSDLE
ncbi:hypothetical protein AAEX63_05810 [Luteococcus sp. H138]|uniref:hypothetical protein n=1 Tax=unclassified Luteococcus TaxID=2639923 RepID=UPI00313BFDBE